MIRRISGKPVIQFHFLSDGSDVGAYCSVKLNRLDLKSGAMLLVVSLWDQELVSRLAELGPKLQSRIQAVLDSQEKRLQLFEVASQIQKERAGLKDEALRLSRERDQSDKARIESAGGKYYQAPNSQDFEERRFEKTNDHRRSELESLLVADRVAKEEEAAAKHEMTALQIELKGLEEQMAGAPLFVREVLSRTIPLEGSEDGNNYALRQGALWSTIHKLEPQQWEVLISRQLERDAAQLAVALGGDSPTSGRERISPEVRRAVWIRDGGCCARCRSRERLEYDHIIAVSLGGSNTERNIELLCEVCNRSKSNKVQ